MSIIQPYTLEFLSDLKDNNNKEWFNANRERYEEAHANMVDFMEALIVEMNKIDNIEPISPRRSLYRIYRDLRFSKDKTPYKIFFSGRMQRATEWLRGGYYFRIQPGGSYLTGGFLNPSKDDLEMIRSEFDYNAEPLREIMGDEDFKNTWKLTGKALKTAPRGYDIDHPNIDLIRMKQFRMIHPISDEIILSENLIFEIIKSFIIIRPFFDYMSAVLTQSR